MKPMTWIFLRGAGRRVLHQPGDVSTSNLQLEISQALEEGCSWQEIAAAAVLPVAVVRRYGAKV